MNKNIKQEFLNNFSEAEKLFKNKNFLESLVIYKKLLNQYPKHISLLNNIGLIYETLGQLDEAIFYYEKCNQILPNQNIVLHNLANVYCKTEKYFDALPLLRAIINCEYKKEDNHEKIALCLFYTKTKKETKNFIEIAIAKFPNNKLLNGLLGKTLLHLDSHSDGLKYLQKSTGLIEFNNIGVKYLS